MRVLGALCALIAAAVLFAACGDDSDTAADGDTVEIAMKDIAFEPDTLEVQAGSTVTMAFTNEGEVTHEAIVGDEEFQEEHEAEMAAMTEDGEDADHEEDDMGMEGEEVTLEPGESGELTHTFDEAGTTYIACHEPGHYDAGMIVEVTVT